MPALEEHYISTVDHSLVETKVQKPVAVLHGSNWGNIAIPLDPGHIADDSVSALLVISAQ
jgi:hypothetical protein